jgi:AmmeMemoRadiSam system protein B
VQLPFVVQLFPGANILPIMVPPTSRAGEVGEAVGRTLLAYDYDAVVVGTTDLTHYGPRYGFAPRGVGPQAHAWAKNENDRRVIDLVCELKAAEVITEAAEHKSACSGGAAAATIAAVSKLGATRGTLLAHTTSNEVQTGRSAVDSTDFVGYAGIVRGQQPFES